MDLDEYISDLRLRALLELIEGRPGACRWREARMEDPDYVEAYLSEEERVEELKRQERAQAIAEGRPVTLEMLDDDDDEYAPPASEFGISEALLARVVMSLGIIAQAVGVDLPEEIAVFPHPRNPIAEERERRDHVKTMQKADGLLQMLAANMQS